MVKGNKFKTAEFLEKQICKAQSKPSAAVTAGPQQQQQQVAGGSSSQQANTKCVSPAPKLRPQQQVPQAGSKRSRSEDAVTQVVDASVPVAALQAAKTGKKQRSPRPHDSPAQPKLTGTAPIAKKQKLSKPAVPTILAAPAPQGKAVNSNWAALKGTVTNKMNNRRHAAKGNTAADRPAALKAPEQIGTRVGLTPVVALDCEMVGVGPDGIRSALAR